MTMTILNTDESDPKSILYMSALWRLRDVFMKDIWVTIEFLSLLPMSQLQCSTKDAKFWEWMSLHYIKSALKIVYIYTSFYQIITTQI